MTSLCIPPNLTSSPFPLGSYQSRTPNSLEFSDYIHQSGTCVFTHSAPLCLQCIPWILSKQLLLFLQNSSQRSFLQQTLPDLKSTEESFTLNDSCSPRKRGKVVWQHRGLWLVIEKAQEHKWATRRCPRNKMGLSHSSVSAPL